MCRMGVPGGAGMGGCWGALGFTGAAGLCPGVQGHLIPAAVLSSAPLPWVLPGGCADSSLHVEAG